MVSEIANRTDDQAKVFFLLIFPTICVFIIVGLTIALIVDAMRKKQYRTLRYKGRERLLSEKELEVFESLRDMLPDEFAVCPKVCLWDAIQFDDLYPINRLSDVDRIQSSRLDFVIMEAATSKIVLAIELLREGDPNEELRQRRNMVYETLDTAGISFLKVGTWSTTEILTVQARIGEFMDRIAA